MVQSNEHEDAVSATVATVLMVAVTVILAALVASFSLGTMGGIPDNGIVGAKAVRMDDGAVLVTYVGGDGADAVDHLNWTIDGTEQTDRLDATVGSSAVNTTVSADPGKKHRVMVVATYSDRSSQVVLDAMV
ncbi:MAG: type IV pilin N-terminal domain-containing protein [Methanofollis sp.]|uniref:type IV pilin N-terminal domain-containing protein n=1 Tax=Methanofollis sp. TaxID=2052835 RepID=UPI002609AF56|nr:type IV pilin N-terminal domain-containing protein [Methanofollis sp.]MDD4254226.1 type IV pilin N-terminal domain-containing protein [Methanofollis sp.]